MRLTTPLSDCTERVLLPPFFRVFAGAFLAALVADFMPPPPDVSREKTYRLAPAPAQTFFT
jgi:hypothetical protein